ncbi:MAG: ABC-2 type transport system permease protein [Arenicella sp.]|jgi:ABC-2 type transport system permease protein
MDTEILFNPDKKETWFFLPGVVGVLIMQIALILTGISVVREREKRTL